MLNKWELRNSTFHRHGSSLSSKNCGHSVRYSEKGGKWNKKIIAGVSRSKEMPADGISKVLETNKHDTLHWYVKDQLSVVIAH